MAFDPDAFLNETEPQGFDPDAFLREEETKDDPGNMEAFKEGALDSITFGFSPEITAAARSSFGEVTYEQALKEERLETEQAQEHRPGAFTTGEVVGTVAGLAIPGGAAVKGIGMAAKSAKVASGISKAKKAATAVKTAVNKASKSPEIRKKIIEGAKDLAIEVGIEQVTGIPGLGTARKLLKKGKIGKNTFDKLKKKFEAAEKAAKK